MLIAAYRGNGQERTARARSGHFYQSRASENASPPESAGDPWGRQLPGCLPKCDFWQMVRLLALRENRPLTENEIGTLILAAAIDVHRELGPGLLESVYEVVLAKELTRR